MKYCDHTIIIERRVYYRIKMAMAEPFIEIDGSILEGVNIVVKYFLCVNVELKCGIK